MTFTWQDKIKFKYEKCSSHPSDENQLQNNAMLMDLPVTDKRSFSRDLSIGQSVAAFTFMNYQGLLFLSVLETCT
jgi:hypothetical protein